jgi:DNA-binding transcriptional regulator GbsR (MarR family)
MKTKNKKVLVKATKDRGLRRETQKAKVMKILMERRDITISKLSEIMGISPLHVGVVLTHLRKMGINVWPSKGHGTPLKIAQSQADMVAYSQWRRNRYLPTMERMIASEFEMAERYAQLSDSPKGLLKALNNAAYVQLPERTNK